MEYNDNALVKTLIYSSIFHYPLTKDELWQYAISEKSLEKKIFFASLSKNSLIQKKNIFYFLPHQEDTVSLRISREKIATKKLHIAHKISAILIKIPTIQFIGISGSLSMANTREEDDIDLFIITKQQSVWFTRVLILIILEILRKRRKKYATHVSNKICINLLMEESHLAFPNTMQNLYTAHEIAQVKPIFNRNKTFENFLSANMWVKKFLPNAFPTLLFKYQEDGTIGRNRIKFLNLLAKKAQLWYMKKHRTSEIITDSIVAFYTNAMQQKVLQLYKEKITSYEI